MTSLKEEPKNSPYELAAAARRAKLAAMAKPETDEVMPVRGRIRVLLSGKAISRERRAEVLATSSIDIPEFSIPRKKKPA